MLVNKHLFEQIKFRMPFIGHIAMKNGGRSMQSTSDIDVSNYTMPPVSYTPLKQVLPHLSDIIKPLREYT